MSFSTFNNLEAASSVRSKINAGLSFLNTITPGTAIDFSSKTDGLIMASRTTAQIGALPSPSSGTFLFNSDTTLPNFYDGFSWNELAVNVTPSWLLPVLSETATVPVSPSVGDRYLATATTGAFTNKRIYEWNGATWDETIPTLNDFVEIGDTGAIKRFNGTSWVIYSGTAILQGGNSLGIPLNVGTNDNKAFQFKTFKIVRGKFTAAGNLNVYNNMVVGSSTIVPTARFQIKSSAVSTEYAIITAGSSVDVFNVRNDGYISAGVAAGNMTIGYGSGFVASVVGNTFCGVGIAPTLTTGFNNTVYGNFACSTGTTFKNNVYIGTNSGKFVVNDEQNVAIGHDSLYTGNGCYFSVAIGLGALKSEDGKGKNTGVGYFAGYGNNANGSAYFGSYSGMYETAGGKLFIDAIDRGTEANGRIQSLIYGGFDADPNNQFLTVNGMFNVGTLIQLKYNDGGATFAGGAASIDTSGNLSIANLTMGGNIDMAGYLISNCDSIGQTAWEIDSTGLARLDAGIKTGDPGSGIGTWLLGQAQTGVALALNTTSYIEIKVDGNVVKLAQVL